ncbi:FAD-dependent monooxygenase [Actinoplanes sp. CA-030573]|uniref:FAD-dependent monooxygenase n=1 Tax=Actinoplanes sp. CA-030573 TaxID=3239898 RepID=UPI003D93CA8D
MSVLVVGAGPTGLVMACALLEAGVPVRLIDAAPGLATTSRALGLQPRGVEVLDRLGALADLPERGLPMRAVVIHVDGAEITRLRVGGRTKLVSRPGVVISQAEIEGALRRRLTQLGGRVEWNNPLTELPATGWVVGCDGAHSQVRKAAGIGFPGVPLIERFIVADLHADLPLPRDAVSTWLAGDQMFALFPLPGGDLWRVLMPEPAGTADDADPESLVTAALPERTGLPAAAITGFAWTSRFRIHRRLADTYRAGRVLLAGDAAHIHSPMGGQGMNTGMGDAENLAWKLALVERGHADETLLDTYEAERRPIAEEVLGNTSSMTRVMLGRTVIERLMRDHVVVPLMNRPFVQRLITEASSQLRVSYKAGPLGSAYPRIGRGPYEGDRIPDRPCIRADGSPTRLHAELGGRWAVLTGDETAARVARRHLGDTAVVTLRCAGVDQTYLVRPDAHLACRGDADRLRAWFSRTLGTPQPALAAA